MAPVRVIDIETHGSESEAMAGCASGRRRIRPAWPVSIPPDGGPAMRTVRGKQFLTGLNETADPGHTALIVYDGVNQVIRSRMSGNESLLDAVPAMLARWKELLEAARAAGVFTCYTVPVPAWDVLPAPFVQHLANYMGGDVDALPFIPVGGDPAIWDDRIIDELAPKDGEVVVRKHFNNAFSGSPLAGILRTRGIRTIVLTGISTESGIEGTARLAIVEDFYPVVVEDCVNSGHPEMHQASLNYLARIGHVTTAADLITLWTAGH
jgi:ureidoacrylate peracid hydrolase